MPRIEMAPHSTAVDGKDAHLQIELETKDPGFKVGSLLSTFPVVLQTSEIF
jgi:hypothetical protein